MSTQDVIYPKNLLPIVAGAPISDIAYEDMCEKLLLGYGYQTARAYLADLQSFGSWCMSQEPPIRPLAATVDAIQAYLADMLDDGYSPNTVARRLTTVRALFDLVVGHGRSNPARMVPPVRRRTTPRQSVR